MTLNTRLVELPTLILQKQFSVALSFYSQTIANPYTNVIIKFYFIICTFPVPNSLFSHLFPSFRIFSLKNLFLLSRPTPYDLCFRAKIRKNEYPWKIKFYYIKVWCKGVFITRTCFRDGFSIYLSITVTISKIGFFLNMHGIAS